jgi:ribonuclease D
MNRLSEEHQVPAENLLTPDTVRRVMWAPAGSDLTAIGDQLRRLGTREWQIELTAPMLLDAVVSGSASAGSTQPVD